MRYRIVARLERGEALLGRCQGVFPPVDAGDIHILIAGLQFPDQFFLLLSCDIGLFLLGLHLGLALGLLLQGPGKLHNIVLLGLALFQQGPDGLDALIHVAVGRLTLEIVIDFGKLLSLCLQVADGGPQGGAQAVILLLHGGLLRCQRLDLALRVMIVFQLTARLNSGIPIGYQLPVGRKLGLLRHGLFLLQVLAFECKVTLIVGLVVHPQQHLLCAFSFLQRLFLLLDLLLNLVVDFGLLVLAQQRDALQLRHQVVALVLLVAPHFKDFLAHLGIDLGAGHLLEQRGLLVLVAVEELGKFALRQHNGAEELAHVQSQQFGDILGDFTRVFLVHSIAGIVRMQGALGRHDFVLDLAVFPVHMPSGGIGDALVVVKREADVGAHGPAAQQLPGFLGADHVLAVARLILASRGAVQSRCGAIQSQADAIDDGGFASARLARDQEQVLACQGRCVKVNLGVLNRGDIIYGEFLEFHFLISSFTDS